MLSIIARDVLTVPVSTVASKAAFNAGGRVVSKSEVIFHLKQSKQ